MDDVQPAEGIVDDVRHRAEILSWLGVAVVGAPSGTRTPNPLIKSQLLCQLS